MLIKTHSVLRGEPLPRAAAALLVHGHRDPVDHLPHRLRARVVGRVAEVTPGAEDAAAMVLLLLAAADEGLDPGPRALATQVVVTRRVGDAVVVVAAAAGAVRLAQSGGGRGVVARKGTHRRI